MRAIFTDKGFFTIFIVTFLVLFFGKIYYNGVRHSEYVDKFKVECAANGGITHIPRGVKGWPVPECRNPSAIIDIEIDT